MSNLTRAMMMGAAGASGDKVYVDDVFSTTVYTGNGASNRAITTGIDNTGKSLVWCKGRDSAFNHSLVDNVRSGFHPLYSNSTGAQYSSAADIQSFTSTGFTASNNIGIVNGAAPYVAWNFKAVPGFMDIVTWTGNGSSGLRSISHNLGSTPAFLITKNYSNGAGWSCWHKDLTSNQYYLQLSETDQERSGGGTQLWDATDTTFSINSGITGNTAGHTFVAYLFASDEASFGTGGNESIIKCGKYTTDGSGSATVDLGFEPQWILNKRIDSAGGDWYIRDVMRGMPVSGNNNILFPNDPKIEDVTSYAIRPSSTGFIAENDGASRTFVYIAIRRPNKPPEVATDVFAIDTGNSSSTTPCWDSGFPVDFAIMSKPSVNYPRQVGTRLMGTKYLSTNYSNAEANDPDFTWDSNLGWGKSWNNLMYSWMFKRAPGFMDVVTYTGNLTARTISHNLSAIPELVIVKNRTDTGGASWAVWSSYLSEGYALILNDTVQAIDRGTQYWNANSTFTTTTFGLGNQPPTNQNTHKFVGYLFASLTGISKIGTYSGTGSAINVDCGFDAGARFVLIKRTDAEVTGTNSSGWYVWDTARGIISGNDPYFRLNDNITQVTNTDYIDPLSTGFTVTASAPSSLNVNGGTYLFLAIA